MMDLGVVMRTGPIVDSREFSLLPGPPASPSLECLLLPISLLTSYSPLPLQGLPSLTTLLKWSLYHGVGQENMLELDV